MAGLSDPSGELFAAIADGDHEAVGRLLEQGADVQRDGPVAMVEAAVSLLLEAGADPTATDDWGRSAAHWAAEGHSLSLARRLAEAQEEAAAGETCGLSAARTRTDAIDTPLVARPGREFLVLVPGPARGEGIGRVYALGAAGDRAAALRIVSDDNTHRQRSGPYLVCRRTSVATADTRVADPLAAAALPLRARAGDHLVITHALTTPPQPGAPIDRQLAGSAVARGWAAIRAVAGADEAARVAAQQGARSEALLLTDVCTCSEGYVEAHESLVGDDAGLRADGDSHTVFPSNGPVDDACAPRARGEAGTRTSATSLDPGHLIRRSVAVFRAFPAGFMGFTLAYLLLTAVVAQAPLLFTGAGLTQRLIHALLMCLGPAPLAAGFYLVVLEILQGKEPSAADFLAGFGYTAPMAVLTIIAATASWGAASAGHPLGFALLAYAAFASMYAPPLVVAGNLDPLRALASSWRLVHGAWGDSLIVLVLLVLTGIAGAAFFGIGLLASLPTAGAMLVIATRARASSVPPPRAGHPEPRAPRRRDGA